MPSTNIPKKETVVPSQAMHTSNPAPEKREINHGSHCFLGPQLQILISRNPISSLVVTSTLKVLQGDRGSLTLMHRTHLAAVHEEA